MVEAPTQSLTLEEKVGQQFIAGFDGTAIPEHVRDVVTERHLGGVVLFDRNVDSPDQVRASTTELQSLASDSGVGWPLFVHARFAA